ncbi:MAG TPA: hypothetical protein VGM03_18725, partial [Phycisphaerae bacterium]
IALPGVKGRFDHMALDGRGRFWLTALGNNSVEVLNLDGGERIESIKGPKEPQGVAFIPDLDRIVVASGEDGIVRYLDESLKVVGSVEGLEDADNVRYDAREKRIYVGYGKGALAVLDAERMSKLSEIPLDGHPESLQLEQRGARIFVNVPDAKHVAVVDREKGKVAAKWPIKEARGNYPMALDEGHGRLFVVCRKPAKLLVLETESGKVLTSVECTGDADDVFYDAARGRIYISGGEGYISIIDQIDADHYRPVAKLPTASGARTSLLSPDGTRLYLAVPHALGREAEVRVYRTAP